MNAYLSIHDKVLDSVRAEGIKKTVADMGEDAPKDEITLSEGLLESKKGDIEFNENTGCLTFYTDLAIKREGVTTDLGYLSDSIEIDLETASSIVNYFMKKLGKLKTVLEATK